MVVSIDEARIDGSAGRNRDDSFRCCWGSISRTPDRFNHAIAHEDSTIIDDISLSDHRHNTPLEDVLTRVDVISGWVAIALDHIADADPFLIIRPARGGRAIGEFHPSATRVVAIGYVPIGIFSTVTHSIDLIASPIENPNGVSIPEIKLDLSP